MTLGKLFEPFQNRHFFLAIAGEMTDQGKGLASHCKAKTTFTFYFSIINAFYNVKIEK